MKHIFILSCCIFLSTALQAQKEDYSAELEKRHGFKNIKLAQPVDSVKGAEFKKDFFEKDEFPAKLYLVKSEFLGSIGEIKVREIQLKTYKNLVYDILVTTDKDPRLMKGMEMALGRATFNIQTDAYHWRGKNLTLTFIGDKNSNTLHYKSYEVYKMMREDSGKKVEAIAEDF